MTSARDLARFGLLCLAGGRWYETDVLGNTVAEYVRSRRLEHAAELLRTTSLPVAAIAERAGFCDHSHFCLAFKRHVGTTPGRYRATTT